MEHALSTAIRDFAGKLPRDNVRDVVLRTQLFLYSDLFDKNGAINWPVRLIETNDKTIVFVTKERGGPWYGGIHSLPKEFATIKAQAR